MYFHHNSDNYCLLENWVGSAAFFHKNEWCRYTDGFSLPETYLNIFTVFMTGNWIYSIVLNKKNTIILSMKPQRMMQMVCNCDHEPAHQKPNGKFRTALWIALILNLLLFVIELIGGAYAHSSALWADALDFFGDSEPMAFHLL